MIGDPELADRTWNEVDRVVGRSVLAIPLGATEQHGPHLPVGTDTAVAVALAQGWAARRPDVLIAPAVPYGSSGEHRGFAGTLSIGQAALELLLVELVRSADAFTAVALICAHGGNAVPVGRAVTTLAAEGRRIRAWSPSVLDGDAHAGRTETSLLLAIDPSLVRLAEAQPGEVRPIGELIEALRTAGVAAVSANGVLGDPTGASAAEGAALLGRLTDDLTEAMTGWPPP